MLKMENLLKIGQPRSMGGRGLISIWDSFKSTNIRIAHFLNKSMSPKLQKCQELDKASLFSICKRAEKFLEGLTIDLPHNLDDRSVIKQAKIIAGKAKCAIQKQRFDTCQKKPQHGIFFKLLDDPTISKKGSLAWMDKAHMPPQTESYITAAQELALFTRWHERNILKINLLIY